MQTTGPYGESRGVFVCEHETFVVERMALLCGRLRSEQIEFDGTLRMQATISEAAGGGIKSMLLKAIDPLFRKGKAGAVVPIKVRGTRDKPKFGVDVMKAITPK